MIGLWLVLVTRAPRANPAEAAAKNDKVGFEDVCMDEVLSVAKGSRNEVDATSLAHWNILVIRVWKCGKLKLGCMASVSSRAANRWFRASEELGSLDINCGVTEGGSKGEGEA